VADPSFWEWYPNFFSFHAADPDGYRLGGFTLAHLWFILFLFVFAVVALPLMAGLRRPGGSRVIEPLARVSSVPGVILIAAVPWWLTVNRRGRECRQARPRVNPNRHDARCRAIRPRRRTSGTTTSPHPVFGSGTEGQRTRCRSVRSMPGSVMSRDRLI
jgi:hypothetical protein